MYKIIMSIEQKTGLNSKLVGKIISSINTLKQTEKIFLYGSRATGSYTKRSDIDLAIFGKDWNRSDINKIKIPKPLLELNYDLERYVQMYLTTSYILTAPENNLDEIIKIFNNHGMTSTEIGSITQERNKLKIFDEKEYKILSL